MPRRRLALLALLAAALARPAAAQADGAPPREAAPCPGGLVVTRAEVEAAGLVYLSDLYRLLPPLRRVTLDALTWNTAGVAGVPFAEPLALVLVDGVPADLDFLGEEDLELLPVPLPEIERVVYCPAPGPAAGVWAGRGTLRVETRRPAPGLTSRGAWQIGNETGDPGPFRYVEDRATPNVDKAGPDAEGALRYERDGLSGVMAAREVRVYATDLALQPRTSTATLRLASNERVLTGVLAGAVGDSARHALTLTGRYVSDLGFVEPAGRELPLRRLDAHADLLGPLPGLPLRYRLAAHFQQATDEDSEIAGFDVLWHRRTLTAALYGAEAADWRYGAALTRTEAGGTGLDDGFTLGTVYGGASARLGRALGGRTDVALTATGSAVGAKAALALGLERARRALWLTVSLDRRLPEEAPGYGFWRARGFTALEQPAVAYVQPAPPAARTEASARLSGRLDGPVFGIEGGASAWAGRGLYVERPAFGLMEDASAAEGAVTAVADADGAAVEAWVEATARRGPWEASAAYSLLAPVSGTAAFRDVWARVPRHRARAAVTLRPDPGFTLYAAFEAQSAPRWPGYEGVVGVVNRFGYVYTGEVPALALLDLAVDKGLWGRRARVSLLFRNLLNTEERYHPLGAALDFRLYARVTVQLRGPLWVGPRSGNGD